MLRQMDPSTQPPFNDTKHAKGIAGPNSSSKRQSRGRRGWLVALSAAGLIAVLLATGGVYIVQQSRVQRRSQAGQPTTQPNVPPVNFPMTGPGLPTPVTRLPVNIPAAQLAWTQPTASGDARSAFAASARVDVQQPDGSVRQQAPVGVLWMGETAIGALAVVQLDTAGDLNALVMERTSASEPWLALPGSLAGAGAACKAGAIPAPYAYLGNACRFEQVGGGSTANGEAANVSWTAPDGSSWFAARIRGAPTGVGAPNSVSGLGWTSESVVLANGQGVLALASTASAGRVQATLAAIQSGPPSPLTTDS